MTHHLHTCLVSYNRLDLTRQSIHSYLETVTLSYSLIVVDNGSDEATAEWLIQDGLENDYEVKLLPINRYPGYATNRGWEMLPDKTTLLHRADNDFSYLPGWCDEIVTRFNNPQIGQVGLRTNREEMKVRSNVGGNNVIRRKLWDDGLRYDERPWGKDYPPGWTEDSLFSPEVVAMGYKWKRVKQPCIVSLASGDWDDEYYQESYSVRGIQRPNA